MPKGRPALEAGRNRPDADYIDTELVSRGDLSGLTDAERRCYEIGNCAGTAAEWEATWSAPLWRRLWWALSGGPDWPVTT